MLLSALICGASASAAPIAVHVRIEGSTKTVFEGNVMTQPETFETESSGGLHPCNYKENGPSSEENKTFEDGGNVSATPTTAVRDAALENGLLFNAQWFGSGKSGTENPGDFFVTQIGSDINETKAPFASWGYAVDDTTAVVGGCQIALAPGNEVLWAYNYFNLKHLLSLSGPSVVNAGMPFTVHVTDGQTGEPVSGAAIGTLLAGVTTPISGSSQTDAGGNATVTLGATGAVTLKATQHESVRSNGLVICVHNSNDGGCGTAISTGAGASKGAPPAISAPAADIARAEGLKNGYRYSRRSAPRLLGGVVEIPPGGTLRQVRISLKRSYRGRCYAFSGRREQFVAIKCRRNAAFFPVGSTTSFSYLLPSRLPAGVYTYDIEAIDGAGGVTKLVNGVSHIVFRVH